MSTGIIAPVRWNLLRAQCLIPSVNALLVIVGFAADLSGSAPTPTLETVDQIAVHTTHSGWVGCKADLTIGRTPKGFSEGKREIDTKLADALIAAALAPRVPSIEPGRLGVTSDQLRAAALKERPPRPAMSTRFAARIADPKNLSVMVDSVFHSSHTDDHPTADVTMTLRGGRALTISSRSQVPFMVPWTIVRDGRSTSGWDPNIGRAIGALLPTGFCNRERIIGETLLDRLVMDGEWRLHEEARVAQAAEEELGDQIAAVRRTFTVERSVIGNLLTFNANGERGWSAMLSSAAQKPIHFSVYFTIHGDKLSSTATFLRETDEMVRRVRSLQWLNRYLAAIPDAQVLIDYYDERSISRFAQARILSGLEARGLTSFARVIAGQLDHSLAIYIDRGRDFSLRRDFSVWIVLPDGRSFLQFGSDPPSVASASGVLVKPDGTPDRSVEDR